MGAGAIAAGVGAAASIGGSLLSASASKSAASQQTAAAQQAQEAALAQQAQVRSDLAPYRNAGTDALSRLKGLLGLPGGEGSLSDYGLPGLTFQPTQAALEATPGYQFNLSQGLRGAENSASAQGLGISGPAIKAAERFATGLASNTLGQQQQIFQANLGNVLSPFQTLVGSGQNAANQTGTLGSQNTQYANQYGVGGANAAASGTVGAANNLQSALGAAGGSPLNYLLYNQAFGSGSGSGAGGTPTFNTPGPQNAAEAQSVADYYARLS